MAETAISSQVDRVVEQYLSLLTQNVDYLMGKEMARRALRSGNVAEIDVERRKLEVMKNIFGLDFSLPADSPSRPYFFSDGFNGYLLRQDIKNQQSLIIFLKKDGNNYQRIEVIDMPSDNIFQRQRTIFAINDTGIFQATLTIASQSYNLSLGVTGDPFADGYIYPQGMINRWFDFDGNALVTIGLPFD